jgi:hypothetical protein
MGDSAATHQVDQQGTVAGAEYVGSAGENHCATMPSGHPDALGQGGKRGVFERGAGALRKLKDAPVEVVLSLIEREQKQPTSVEWLERH